MNNTMKKPWKLKFNGDVLEGILDDNDIDIADFPLSECENNARLIVKSVNCHDELVLLCKESAIVIADSIKLLNIRPEECPVLNKLMKAIAKAEALI